ncbi:MAG: hypothetical protein ACI9TY_000465 [Alphaproteobacteria bacterium]|jgi:hypothetical protein
MSLIRLKTEILHTDIRPSLIKEMQEKEAAGTLNAETDIIPYYFYLATKNKTLSLENQGLQTDAMIFESAFRSKAKNKDRRKQEEAHNLNYAHKCAYLLIQKGYMPYASHIKYTGPLDDSDSHHRTIGIVMGKLEEVAIPEVTIFPECGVSFGIVAGCMLHTYLNKEIGVSALNPKVWLPEDSVLTFDEGYDFINENIFSKRIEFIHKIDEIIGLKTII